MLKTIELLEQVKAAYGLPSDYALAKKLGLTRGAVSKYRCQGTTLDDKVAIEIAELLDLNPLSVVASMHAERAERQNDETLISFWSHYAH